MNRRDALVAVAGGIGALSGAQALGITPTINIRPEPPDDASLEIVSASIETVDTSWGDKEAESSVTVRNTGSEMHRVRCISTPILMSGATLNYTSEGDTKKIYPDKEWKFSLRHDAIEDKDAQNADGMRIKLLTCANGIHPKCTEVLTDER
jgi:hypothetical protein